MKSRWVYANPLKTDQYFDKKEAVLSDKRKALIEEIKQILPNSPAEATAIELKRRLARLYMEDYRRRLGNSFQKYNKMQEKFLRGEISAIPPIDNHAALKSLNKAILWYEHMKKKYPSHPFQDEVLYGLGFAYLDRGDETIAIAELKDLINRFTDSPFVSEALLVLGDYHFDKNELSTADDYYSKILSRDYDRAVAYAYYKKAWCAYNSGKTAAALHLFREAIRWEDKIGEASSLKIRSEAARDIALPFVDLGKLNESIKFFSSLGQDEYLLGLETMAGLYSEAGQYTKAIRLWQLLLIEDPLHRQAPVFDMGIADAYRQMNENKKAGNHLFDRIPFYLKKSQWFEYFSKINPKLALNHQSQLEEKAQNYAQDFHALAQKTNNVQLYEVAKSSYLAYLDQFPGSEARAEIRFNLAEIFFREKSYGAAASAYLAVAQEATIEKLRQDSLRNVLISIDFILQDERHDHSLTSIDNIETITPYSDNEKQFLDTSTEYVKQWPLAKEAAELQLRSASILQGHGDMDAARTVFWNVISNYPTHPGVYSAALWILNDLNERQDFGQLVVACTKFLESSQFSNKEFRDNVAKMLRVAELKRIEGLEQKEPPLEIANRYNQFVEKYGSLDPSLHEKALYNAAGYFTKARAFELAVDSQKKFLARFPQSPLRESVLLELGKNYEGFGLLDKAAKTFEKFYTDFPKHSQAKFALQMAGLYYWGSGKHTKAENLLRDLKARFPSEKHTADRLLISVAESRGSTSKQIAILTEIRQDKEISAVRFLEITLQLAETMGRRRGRLPISIMEEAVSFSNKFVKKLKRDPLGIELLAQVRFWEVVRDESSTVKMSLSKNPTKIISSVQSKLKQLKSFESRYARVVRLGSGYWGTAALFRVASLYGSLYTSVTQIPIPSGFNAKQQQEYEMLLSTTVLGPIKEKAISIAEECLKKNENMEVLSPWMARCYLVASDLDSQRFPKIRSGYAPPFRLALIQKDSNSDSLDKIFYNAAYPYYSPQLFQRSIASLTTSPFEWATIRESVIDLNQPRGSMPAIVDYTDVRSTRADLIAEWTEKLKPDSQDSPVSLMYLQLLSQTSPESARVELLKALRVEPDNVALHNLLALTYIQLRRTTAATVTWLSLIVRNMKTPEIWNNLGVLAYQEEKERLAIEYFREATNRGLGDAYANLGAMALKYRNGPLAKKYFDLALQKRDSDLMAKIGKVVGAIQSREFDAIRSDVIALYDRYQEDPFIRQTAYYFFTDIEKQAAIAKDLLAQTENRMSVPDH